MPDDISSGVSADTATSTISETASAAPVSTGTQTPAPAPSTTNTSSASPDAQSVGGVPPAAPATAGKPDQAPVVPPVHDWQKRFGDLQAHTQRIQAEAQTRVKALEGLPDPAELRSIYAEHQKRQQASTLKPWNSGHNDHAKFQAKQQLAERYREDMGAAKTPEEQAFVNRRYEGQFNPDDIRMIQEAETDRKAQISRLQSDPQGWATELVTPLIRQEIQQAFQYQMRQQEAQGFISDPNTANLIERYAPDMARMIDPNIPVREKAMDYARMKAENDALRAQLSQQVEVDSQREAQQDARQRGPRGPRPSQPPVLTKDPVAVLAERGIQPGTEQYSAELQKLNRSFRK